MCVIGETRHNRQVCEKVEQNRYQRLMRRRILKTRGTASTTVNPALLCSQELVLTVQSAWHYPQIR